jgi:low affinity Fe/Cu permease
VKLSEVFSRFARTLARVLGQPEAFVISLALVIVWVVTGPIFHWSDTWQLVINTWTSIMTFLMVFLLQNTQNRDTMAMQLKLAELLRAMEGARTEFGVLEELNEEALLQLKTRFEQLAERSAQRNHNRPVSGDTALAPQES